MLRVANFTVVVCLVLAVTWGAGCDGDKPVQERKTDDSTKGLVDQLANSMSDIAIAQTAAAKLMERPAGDIKPFISQLEKAWKVEPDEDVKKEMKKVLAHAKKG